MMQKLYATLGDTIVTTKNKHGEEEAKTVEGQVVIKDIAFEGAEDFQAKYRAIQTLYPGAVVRYQKEKP